MVFALSRKILERLCGLGGCKSARPGGGRALRGGAHARLYSAHWHQVLTALRVRRANIKARALLMDKLKKFKTEKEAAAGKGDG